MQGPPPLSRLARRTDIPDGRYPMPHDRNPQETWHEPDTTLSLEDIMWNKISKSRQQDIIVITCGLLLILLAKVLA